MSLHTRVKRLAEEARKRGIGSGLCPACWERKGCMVVVTADTDEAPAACEVCGEVPEDVIEVEEILVGMVGEAC